MPKYFEFFPKTKYNDRRAVNITKRVSFVDRHLSNVALMLPYTVMDNEKPEDIAYDYYGSIDYYWIILMANNMHNYYEDWPMSNENLEKYIMSKYKEQSGKTGYEVISWTMNQTILDNILYYIDGDGNTVSVDTVILNNVPVEHLDKRKTIAGQNFLMENYLGSVENMMPLRIYDYEYEHNENKRNIILVNKIYLDRVISDFKKSFK